MTADRRYPYGLFEGVFQGWWLAVALAVIGFLVSREGLPDLAQELMAASLPDIDEAFDPWNRLGMVTSLANGPLPALLALAGAWLVDRHGPRRVALFGLPIVVLGYLVLVGSGPLNWVMYLSVALLTIGASVGFAWVPAATLNNWFHRRKATAMAIPIVAFALWGRVIDPLTGFLIGGLGWRLSTAAVGVAALAVVMPLALLIRDRPEDHGRQPDGRPPDVGGVLPDYTWSEAVRSRAFWLLIAGDACVFSVAMAALPLSSEIAFNLDRAWIDWDRSQWVRVIAVPAAALLADRIPIRHVLSGLGLVMAAAIALLATGTPVGSFLFDILVAVSWGGGSIVPFAARGIYFGRRQFATIAATSALVVLPFRTLTSFGLLALMGVTGGAIMPLLLGLVVSVAGSLAYRRAGPPSLAPSQ